MNSQVHPKVALDSVPCVQDCTWGGVSLVRALLSPTHIEASSFGRAHSHSPSVWGLQPSPLTQQSGWPAMSRPGAHLLIGLPPPCPWQTEVSLFPNWYKVLLEPSCPLPFPVFIFHDFSGLQEVINCFGLKALLLGRSLRGRIKVNKQKGTVSSKASAPTFLMRRETRHLLQIAGWGRIPVLPFFFMVNQE